MARTAPNQNLEPVLKAARSWIDRCLIKDGSVFSGAQLWTKALAGKLRKAYVEKPDESDKRFWEKLRGQLKHLPKQAIQLAAEMIWALYLFPWGGRNADIRASTKRDKIREVWGWSGATLPKDQDLLGDKVLMGIGGAGQNYKKLWHELAFLVRVTCDLKGRPVEERKKLFNSYDEHCSWVDSTFPGENKQFRHMLRYFTFPDRVERIASGGERVTILDAFLSDQRRDISQWDESRIDKELHNIRKLYEKDYPDKEIDFYHPPLSDAWRNDGERPRVEKVNLFPESDGFGGTKGTVTSLLESCCTRSVMLLGPAGTGKTFMAEEVADVYGGLKSNRVELVQFHPAYSYEDFMEGLRPRAKDRKVDYRVRSGTFKAFCRRAAENPEENHLFIIDEINRGNIAKVMGELMYCLEYRGEKHAITLPYSRAKFFIPENVHILGTMNSSDRSIATLDVALRRRFQFVELAPDSTLLNGVTIGDVSASDLLNELNGRILTAQGRHKLLGHSYFMPPGYDDGNTKWEVADFKARWFHQILPLLEEYFVDDVEALRRVIGEGWETPERSGNSGHFVPLRPESLESDDDFLERLPRPSKHAGEPASAS